MNDIITPVFHNIPPVYDEESLILILGSFPSVRSREEGFFYMHARNRFWSVMAAVLGCEEPKTVPERRAMLLSHRIALWDVCASCTVKGSGDSTIRNAVPNDIAALIGKTQVKAVFANGKTAYTLYKKHIEEKTGIAAVLLPSTSPANASFGFEKLLGQWSAVSETLSKLKNNIL